MICRQCGHPHPPDARFCTNCGTAIAKLTNPSVSAVPGQLEKIQQDLEETLKSSTAYLTNALQGLSPRPARPFGGGPDTSGSPPDTPLQESKAGSADVAEFAEVLAPKPSQIHQSASFTLSSPFIQENAAYAKRVSSINFVYMDHDLQLNAYATDHPVTLEDGTKVTPPVVVFLAGLDVAIRLAAAALSTHLAVAELRQKTPGSSLLAGTLSRIGETLRRTGKFGPEASLAIFKECVLPSVPDVDEHTISLTRSYTAAMESFVIAHEAGHVALGHTQGGRQNLDVSRNQEREADSFAASTLSTSPFRDYLFLGGVFVTIIFSWTEFVFGNRPATTHPLGRERFFNLLRSNSASADEVSRRFGLTTQRLTELLPEG